MKNKKNNFTDRNKNRNHYRKPRPVTMGQSVYSLAIRCYAEQLSGGTDEGWKETLIRITSLDKTKYKVVAIQHDKDGKIHYHIAVIAVGNGNRPHVSTILNMLGIHFRKDIDQNIMEHRGLETVGSFEGFLVYILHRTPKAIAEGKTLYSLEDVVSNLDPAELKQIIDGQTASTPRTIDINRMLPKAEAAGYELESFERWLLNNNLSYLSENKRNALHRAFNRGIDKFIQEGNDIHRLCIFIGFKETEKTKQGNMEDAVIAAIREALDGNRAYLMFGDSDYAKSFISSSLQAIISYYCSSNIKYWNGRAFPSLLELTSYQPVRFCRGTSNKGFWIGRYVIIISEVNLDDNWNYPQKTTCKLDYGSDEIREVSTIALYQRHFGSNFFICHLDRDSKLYCDLPCYSNGRIDVIEDLKRRFIDFRLKFDSCIDKHLAGYGTVDFSDINS